MKNWNVDLLKYILFANWMRKIGAISRTRESLGEESAADIFFAAKGEEIILLVVQQSRLMGKFFPSTPWRRDFFTRLGEWISCVGYDVKESFN